MLDDDKGNILNAKIDPSKGSIVCVYLLSKLPVDIVTPGHHSTEVLVIAYLHVPFHMPNFEFVYSYFNGIPLCYSVAVSICGSSCVVSTVDHKWW